MKNLQYPTMWKFDCQNDLGSLLFFDILWGMSIPIGIQKTSRRGSWDMEMCRWKVRHVGDRFQMLTSWRPILYTKNISNMEKVVIIMILPPTSLITITKSPTWLQPSWTQDDWNLNVKISRIICRSISFGCKPQSFPSELWSLKRYRSLWTKISISETISKMNSLTTFYLSRHETH